jgi:hypothetical protein
MGSVPIGVQVDGPRDPVGRWGRGTDNRHPAVEEGARRVLERGRKGPPGRSTGYRQAQRLSMVPMGDCAGRNRPGLGGAGDLSCNRKRTRQEGAATLQDGQEWRRGSESNRRIKVLQTSPLPLGYRASKQAILIQKRNRGPARSALQQVGRNRHCPGSGRAGDSGAGDGT